MTAREWPSMLRLAVFAVESDGRVTVYVYGHQIRTIGVYQSWAEAFQSRRLLPWLVAECPSIRVRRYEGASW